MSDNDSTTIKIDTKAEDDASVAIIDEELLRDKIHVVRGQKVMLDFELAEIYGYTTKNFNRQVKNNIAKFEGEDFMFQLTASEWEVLRCNICTSSWGGIRYAPHAFTEQGVYMLMTILKGELAVTRSELSEMLLDFGNPAVRRDYLLLNNQPIEAAVAYAELYGSARESILVVDNYIGLGTLLPLKAVHPDVAITVASDNVGHGLHASELATFRAEYPEVDISFVCTCGKVHDRYIALDFGTRSERVFLCGASSKDAGTRASTILEAEHPDIFHELLDELLSNPPLELG